jgi:peroxiredoxin (alkyl hydroperoxide reductase subunit C)
MDFETRRRVTQYFLNHGIMLELQTEIISFSEKHDEFAAINAQVLAISTDSHHTHLAWSRTHRKDGGVGQLNIPLVADTSKKISASYGVLVTDEDDDMFGAALRGLFIIGNTSVDCCDVRRVS